MPSSSMGGSTFLRYIFDILKSRPVTCLPDLFLRRFPYVKYSLSRPYTSPQDLFSEKGYVKLTTVCTRFRSYSCRERIGMIIEFTHNINFQMFQESKIKSITRYLFVYWKSLSRILKLRCLLPLSPSLFNLFDEFQFVDHYTLHF